MVSQSALRPEHSNSNGTNVGLTDVLSRQPPFQKLSLSEQEELKVMLEKDFKKMKLQFGRLVTITCDSVDKRIPVVKFAGSILVLGAYKPATEGEEGGEGQDRPLLNEHRKEINRAKTVPEIFNILSAYWNYLNYEILEYIIDLYGTSDDKERLKSYSEELHKFCKRRIFELPLSDSCSSNGNTVSPRQEKFNVKFDVGENITYEAILQIRGRIAGILHVNVAALIIVGVDVGCIQLTFLIPKFMAQEIFPLSDDQTSGLSKEAGVIKLEHENYVFQVLEK